MKIPNFSLPFRAVDMKGLRFGIREKTALLVMAVAVAVAQGTSYFLERISTRLVERHELVDLDDEANLRAWDITSRYLQLKEDMRNLVSDENVGNSVYEAATPDTPANLRGYWKEHCDQWDNYLAVQVVDGQGEPLVNVLQKIRGVDPTLIKQVVDSTACLPGEGSVVMTSKIFRVQAEMGVPPEADVPVEWNPDKLWLPIVVACARVQPPDATQEPRYLLITMYLKPPTSPRHLFFLAEYKKPGPENEPVEVPGQNYVMHPNMAIGHGLSEETMFEESVKKALEAGREYTGDPRLFRIRRIAQLNFVPLGNAYHFYFREGRPVPALKELLDKERKRDPVNFERFQKFLVGKTGSDRQVGGLAARNPEIRLLTNNLSEVADKWHGEGKNLRQQVEAEIRTFTSFPKGKKMIDWDDPVECTQCHISCLEMDLDTSEGKLTYLIMYAAFHEEFIGAISQGIESGLRGWVIVFASVGVVIAFFAALFFIQPLQKMTETAQHVVAEKGVLHEKLEELSKTLPTERNDEVGDIARASKRLFQEVVTNHEQLETRVRDRTMELEMANQKLESLAKEKDAFLANVSHELRTPLTAVSGFLQLLKRKNLGEKELNYVTKALHGAAHLEALIDDILDFQKIIMGGLSLDPSEFEAQQMLSELSDALQFHATKYGNTLKITHDPQLTTLFTDRQRLRQVLMNLTSNACKFTKDGVVEIKAHAFDRGGVPHVRFRVIDSGRGMTPEEQKRLFTRFHTTKKANESGTGLGLVISEELCKLMGGRLFLESSVPGVGTTFTIEMPQRMPPPPAPPI